MKMPKEKLCEKISINEINRQSLPLSHIARSITLELAVYFRCIYPPAPCNQRRNLACARFRRLYGAHARRQRSIRELSHAHCIAKPTSLSLFYIGGGRSSVVVDGRRRRRGDDVYKTKEEGV